jgi:hypothetical protein
VKDFKVRNAEGQYLSFDFDATAGTMTPLWGPPAIAYSFTEREATRLAEEHGAFVERPKIDVGLLFRGTQGN